MVRSRDWFRSRRLGNWSSRQVQTGRGGEWRAEQEVEPDPVAELEHELVLFYLGERNERSPTMLATGGGQGRLRLHSA